MNAESTGVPVSATVMLSAAADMNVHVKPGVAASS